MMPLFVSSGVSRMSHFGVKSYVFEFQIIPARMTGC
jgi:hypothetical protein